MRERFGYASEKKSNEENRFLISALEKMEKNKDRLNEIDMNKFREMYTDKFVDIDLEYIKDKEEEFEEEALPSKKEAENRGKIMEALTILNLPLWMGENVTARKASRFDDIRNKIDAVVEIDQETSREVMALAVDVTHVSGLERGVDRLGKNLEKKLRSIKKEIDNGRLGTIKYFESGDGTFQGKLSQIPRVVVGIDTKTLREIVEIWLGDREEEMKNHPVAFQIIEEIEMQLETFLAYAREIKQTKVQKALERQLKILQKIREDKMENLDETKSNFEYREKDRAFKELKLGMGNFRNL